MDRLLPEAIERIEADLVHTLGEQFQVDLHRVLFDATNFFTFIDTFNQRSTFARLIQDLVQRCQQLTGGAEHVYSGMPQKENIGKRTLEKVWLDRAAPVAE